uniref:Transmembrane protein 100-like n=1 Tax=Scleropages formosus TaxID=113540 RepID=A0A8C9S9J7_SCLFO
EQDPVQPTEGTPQDVPGKAPEAACTLERLAQATGGTEKSWYRCVFPFGVISLVIGAAGTAVTFTFNNLPQTKVVSLVLLGVGLVLVLLAAACWRIHKMKRRKKKDGGSFSSEQCPL